MNKTTSATNKQNVLFKLSYASYIIAITSFISLSLSLLWFYNNLSQTNLGPEWLAVFSAASILILALCHIVLLWFLWARAKSDENPSIIRSASISFGCVSLISLAVMAIALSDIGNQTERGLSSSSEWMLILISIIFTLLFILFSAFEIIKLRKKQSFLGNRNDDVLFITINEVGMICALMSVLAVVFGFIVPVLDGYRNSILVIFTAIAFFPWGLMLIGWFVTRQKKVSSWWDEKQMLDMGRSAFWGLIGVVSLSAVLYAAGLVFPEFDASLLWFPAVIISAVAVFSTFNVVYSR